VDLYAGFNYLSGVIQHKKCKKALFKVLTNISEPITQNQVSTISVSTYKFLFETFALTIFAALLYFLSIKSCIIYSE